LLISALLLITPITVHAQDHAGHAASQATEKPKAAAPPTKTPSQGQPVQAVQEAPQVEITPELQQRIGVKTVKAVVKPIQKTIRTVGRVEADERSQATVNTKIEGWIEKLYVDYTGRYVKRGEPLAEIYSPELLATQQEFINTKKWAGKEAEPAPQASHNHSVQAAIPESTSVLKQMLQKDATATLAAAKAAAPPLGHFGRTDQKS